jgi:signal peptidase I
MTLSRINSGTNSLTEETKFDKKTDSLKNDPSEKEAPEKETLSEAIAGFASVFVSGLFIITFVLQHFEIPSSSMERTLLIGDHVFVDRLTPTGKSSMPLLPYRDLHRGDTAVFVSPAEPGLFLVKRIIAVEGDKIHLRDGKVFLNGVPQNEPYAIRSRGDVNPYRDNFPAVPGYASGATSDWSEELPRHIEGQDLVIPKDSYFAMGDNRDVSYDSRYWGFVPKGNVLGRPLFIAWSLDQTEADFAPQPFPQRIFSFLHTAAHFFTLTRWNRVFRLVH